MKTPILSRLAFITHPAIGGIVPFIFLLAAFTAAKLAFFLKYNLPGWDEAVYLGMGKYIYSLGSSGLWEVIRPPGLPLAVGWAWKLGLPYTAVSELVAVLFSIGSILLTYLVSKRLFSKNAAVLAASFLAASPWFFLYSSYILTEIPSAFFVLLSVYFFISRRYYFCGAAAALAVLFKFTNALLVVAVAATVVFSLLRAGKLQLQFSRFQSWLAQLVPLAKASVSFIAVALPFLAFNYFFYRSYTSNFFHAVFRPFLLASWHQSNPAKAIASQLYSYSFYFIEALRQHFAFVFAAVAVFLFFRKKWFLNSGRLFLAAVLALYLAYFSYIPNKDGRFLLLFLPFICIFSAAAFFESIRFCRGIRQRHLRSLALVSAASLLAFSFSIAVYTDYHFYSWRPASEPEMVQELYGSLSRLGIDGPVLTSEPVFAAYNDNLFFAYYDSSRGIPKELKPSWDITGRPAEAVVFSPETLYCPAIDIGCYAGRDMLYEKISSSFLPVFNGTYFEGKMSYFIFVNESIYQK
ncbi:glycosyltransferase family 39 protein [Candidatus Woesearchaeota archaeon]|nr:glycosyltransferase family 39 protein [Candidatus Woesearchaeota archaeon]